LCSSSAALSPADERFSKKCVNPEQAIAPEDRGHAGGSGHDGQESEGYDPSMDGAEAAEIVVRGVA
jgi:hypothetical protein